MATGLTPLAARLTRARFATREGESYLFVAGVLALTVASTLAFTVGGGTWMFWHRWQHPTGLHAELVKDELGSQLLGTYVGLAALACALLVPAVVGLIASAAVLGARGRERRMAALRLLGLTSGEVTRMVLVETVLQALVGVALGYLVYLVTLPAWGALELQAMPIGPGEMLVPVWLALLIAATTVVLAALAAAWGMQQVRVSPLGVARRASSPALRWWRLLAFAVLCTAAWVMATRARPAGDELTAWLVVGTALLALTTGMNLVGPWFLQVLSLLMAHLPWPAATTAARRVAADPRSTWRRVSGIGFMTFIGTYVAMMPLPTDANGGSTQESFVAQTAWDFTKGAVITLAVGLLLAATATYITQASAVFERADQSRALRRMGASAGFMRRVTWLEVIVPLALSMALGAALAAAIASPMAETATQQGFEQSGTGPAVVLSVVLLGLLLTALAVAATGVLQRRVLQESDRRTD